MRLTLASVVFDGPPTRVSQAVTADGSALSVIFDQLVARSGTSDTDPMPQTVRLDGEVLCAGHGWVTVQARGAGLSSDAHGYAHATVWANGRRLRSEPAAANEPFVSAVVAPVEGRGIRLSVLLLAQRDLGIAGSAAECWLDTLDIQVIDHPRRAS